MRFARPTTGVVATVNLRDNKWFGLAAGQADVAAELVTSAEGLVFAGRNDEGHAIDSENGRKLWEFMTLQVLMRHQLLFNMKELTVCRRLVSR